MSKFLYQGRVQLLTQEGGFAGDTISLLDLPGEPPRDLTHGFLATAMGHDYGTDLARALERQFLVAGISGREVGDLGRLCITVDACRVSQTRAGRSRKRRSRLCVRRKR